MSWTGFASIDHEPTRGTMLLFRELNADADWTTEVLLIASATRHITVLGGNGTAVLEGDKLRVHIPEKLQYLWLRIDPGA
jgi:hypothetical protein